MTATYTTLITLHHSYNSTTLQTTTTVAVHHTTSSSCRWGDHCKPLQPLQQTQTPTTFRSISGFALPSVIHNNQRPPIGFLFWNFRHRLVRYYWYLDYDHDTESRSCPTKFKCNDRGFWALLNHEKAVLKQLWSKIIPIIGAYTIS